MTKKLSFRETHDAIDFSETLRRPDLWIRSADELLAAARALSPAIEAYWQSIDAKRGFFGQSGQPSLQGPQLLLVAFAIENLFKALIVQREHVPSPTKLLRKLPVSLKSHDLLKLAADVGFRLSISDEDLCFRMTRCSIWAGRYPIPAGPRDKRSMAQLSDGKVYLAAYFAPSDSVNSQELAHRIRDFVEAELRAAQQGVEPDVE